MKIRHLYPSASSRGEVSGPRAFFLRNQMGDMLSFFTERQTRYEGWSVWRNTSFIKLIERIEPVDAGAVSGVTIMGNASMWEYANGTKLTFRLASNVSGGSVSAASHTALRVILDTRSQYNHPTFGRTYSITSEKSGVLVEYSDDMTHAFIHFRSKGGVTLDGSWNQAGYTRDAARTSEPSSLHVYTLGTITTDALHFGYGETAEEARAASLTASKGRSVVPLVGINHTNDTLLNQVSTARTSVNQSLKWLQSEKGIWAGLPWFHQVWSRDELIALLGLSRGTQLDAIEQYLGQDVENGELFTYRGSGTTCADGVGWLALLIREHGESTLPTDTRERAIQFFTRVRIGLYESRIALHGFVASGNNGTWMDTIGREGYCLDVQLMYALVLDLLHSLTGEQAYHQERLALLSKVREHFWTGTHLADRLGDPTKRPNVFLAYLLQPDLLTANLWQKCFDTVLEATRTPWGGLASIDQSDSRFQPRSTGQNNLSYHNGDSWFFVNNMAAVALSRFNARRYGKVITGILESSTNEILWEHFLGHPGEIASAQELASWGCGIQAFSGGAYLYLVHELEGYSSGQTRESISSFWEATADSTDTSFLR